MLRVRTAIVCLAVVMTFSSARGEDWPGWRGPRGDGTSLETNVPVKWSGAENVAWKVKLDVGGHASPVVRGDRVYVAGADVDARTRVLVALDRRTGEPLWRKTVLESPLEKKHTLNSWASSTPAVDGERIYVSFLDEKSMYVAALDLDGDVLWSVRPGGFSSIHGYCSSPVLYKDKVIVNGDHDGAAYLVALDRATGKTLWKVDRENRTRSYCTPIIRDMAGRTREEGAPVYRQWVSWMWHGKTSDLIAALAARQAELGLPEPKESATSPRQIVSRALTCLQNQQGRMRYPEYRKLGLPITSSHMESTIKELNYRLKGTEKFWSEDGGASVLQLKSDTLSASDPLAASWRQRSQTRTGLRSNVGRRKPIQTAAAV